MGSSPVDKQTMQSSSSGAQAQDAQLAQNAKENQAFADQARKSMFGSYDPTTGRYSGGSVSGFLDPNNLNQTGLSGTYKNQYNTAANSLANQTKNAVGTTMQTMANHGMGRTPAGFAADQERQAYQGQAGELANLYGAAAQQQYEDALNNYWNATNMLNSNASQTANMSLAGNQAAANNYANLYGTAAKQKPSTFGSIMGTIGQLGSQGASAFGAVAGA